jgi:transposase
MYGVRQRVLLRHLLDSGRPIAAIARELGLHRTTVHRWITAGLLDHDLDALQAQYTPRPPVATKLDPFKPLVAERLAAYPRLSAVRLLVELTAAGYTGGLTRLKLYLRTVRPPPAVEPLVRFETPPGHQAQIDFLRTVLPWGIRYGLVVVLSYSRLLWVRFYPHQDRRTLFHGLAAAFTTLQGVPREVLLDQMRAARWWGTSSSCASPATMGSARAPVDRIGRRRRERSNARSATCGTASSTAARSSTTPI